MSESSRDFSRIREISKCSFFSRNKGGGKNLGQASRVGFIPPSGAATIEVPWDLRQLV